MDEELVIRGCRSFDPYAQKCLYNYFCNVMRLVCSRYANNDEDAKDIMQEGFVKVFLNIKKYEG
ncbi:MAG TPA: sigma factor, partial [Cytophagaceae bacterium]